MSSPVLELQHLCTDSSHDISDLLRKALLIASKLNCPDFVKWIRCELEGYSDNEVPAYRKARGDIRAKNPYHGLIPFYFQDVRIEKLLCNVDVRDPVPNLSEIVKSHGPDASNLIHTLSAEERNYLLSSQDIPLEPVRLISITVLWGIIDAVRTALLDWAIRLEAEGIVGQGVSFSSEEKERARAMNINIGVFQGILGDISSSTVTQTLSITVQKGDLDSLIAYFSKEGISAEDLDELRTAINEDPRPTDGELGPKTSDWYGKMVGKAASGAWKVAIAIAPGLILSGLKAFFGLP